MLGLSGLIHVDGIRAVFVCGLASNAVSTGADRTDDLAMEAERLGIEPVVLGAGSLVVAVSTLVHGITSSPGRTSFRRVTSAGDHVDAPGRRAT